MNSENKIIEYLKDQSKGFINLSLAQARQIIRIAQGDGNGKNSHICILKYSPANQSYIFHRIIETVMEQDVGSRS
jgi:hypothetical protein